MSAPRAGLWITRAWGLLIASSALYFLADNEADNDLWMHLFSGRLILDQGHVPRGDAFSYTAAGMPWVDHEWLTQAGFAALFDSLGPNGLWLAKLAAGLLTAWLVWRPLARRSASPWVRGAVMVLTLAILARGFAVRPQVVTYCGVAALLAWLDRRERMPITWTGVAAIAVAFALWANAHGAFIVGLGILGLYALLPGWPPRDARAGLPLRLALVAAAIAGACLTPYGPGLFAYIANELQVPHPLSEWQPVHLGDSAHAPVLVLLAALVATLPFARTLRRQPWWAALVALIAVMALRHQRHTPLLALVAAAPLADQLDGALTWLAARSRVQLSHAATALAGIGLAALALVQLGLLAERLASRGAGIVYDGGEYPVGALRFARDHGLSGNLALPLDWGGYALWHTAPALKVSLDGRFATVYPPHVVEDNFAFFRADGSAGAARLLDAYDTTLVLMPRGFPTPVTQRPGWQLLYTDQVAALYGRSGTPATAASEAPRGWLAFP